VIIKIHGTRGSGKTTIIRELMKMSDPVPAECVDLKEDRVEAMILHLPGVMKPVVALGPYGKAHCGGLDAISGTDVHAALLHRYVTWGHVIYEGLLGSECYGAMGIASERYHGDHLFAFLDTPIEICIDRVKQRRLDAGNTKPLNEANTRGRVAKINRLKYRLNNEFDRWVFDLDHLRATQQIYELLRNAI